MSDDYAHEDDDYQAAGREADEYLQPTAFNKPKDKKSRKWLPAVLVLIIAAGGIYWFFLRSKPAPVPAKTSQPDQSQAASQISATTKHYTSSNFSLEFDYPSDWTVTDSGGGLLSVKSPSLKLKDSLGQTQPGQIALTMRDKTQKLPEFDKGNSTAVIDSEKISYTKPTSAQRGSTYLSFLNYASGGKGLDGVYVTGDFGYKKDQAIPLVDIQKVDPVISITFFKCPDSKCSDKPASLTLDSGYWADNNFADPLKKMLQSLAVQ